MKLSTILATVMTCGIVAVIIGPFRSICGASREQNTSQTYVFDICIGIEGYKRKFGTIPDVTDNQPLARLLDGKFIVSKNNRMKEGEYIDGWGAPLSIRKTSDFIEVRSSGKDGIFYTADDIAEKIKTPNQRLQTMRFKLPMNALAQAPHV